MKKIVLKIVGGLIAVMFVVLSVNINFDMLFGMPECVYISLNEIGNLNESNVFGRCINAEISENIITVGGEKKKQTSFVVKLFGIIPIKKVSAVVEEEKQVYVGGIPLGFSINTKGLIVLGNNKVGENDDGKTPFKTGDIIIKIADAYIEKPDDIYNMLSNYNGGEICIEVLRNNEIKNLVLFPKYDDLNEEYKLGVWVRDDAQGIGTLTFVSKDGKFGALGHSICDYETGVEIPVLDGGVYMCNLIGINKASKGKAGELRCLFSQSKNSKGVISKNSKSGVFGEITNKAEVVDANLVASIGSRMLVKLGKAKLVSSVSGIREEYDIEIIKAKYQSESDGKSFVFRVIDKKLINLTGGIVQGMSGSPIIQNGKIIGAVTHVFLNDATKGYGIYLDWMLEEVG